MKITKQELTDLNACEAGLERFIQQTNNTDEPVNVAGLVGGLNTHSDVVWLACEKLTRARIIRLACDCALINIELIKPYTNKYDLIVDFLKNPDKFSVSDMLAVRSAVRSAVDNTAVYTTADKARDTDHIVSAVHYAVRIVDVNTTTHFVTYAVANAVAFAAIVSPDAVNKLLIDMFNEVE